MDELSGTENRIAVERQRYNERIQEYNTATKQFPANLTAKMFGFKEYPFFQAPPEATQVPKVNFTEAVVRSLRRESLASRSGGIRRISVEPASTSSVHSRRLPSR